MTSGPDRHQLPVVVRRIGAAVAVAALGALIAIGPPVGAARAASGTGFDQITGSGLTDSAVKVSWTSGLLDNTNKPIGGSPADELASNADRSSQTGPLSFMYNDFKNLQVTVSQTQDLTQQGVTVSWTGGLPSVAAGDGAQYGFLQLMECYGDNAQGPDPSQCEFGTPGMLAKDVTNKGIGQRTGVLCPPGATPSPPAPGSFGGGVAAADGEGALKGCDPQERGVSGHVAPCPGPGCDPTGTAFDVPFVPAPNPDGTTNQPEWDPSQTSADFIGTNEIQEALTGTNGAGKLQFATLTGTESPGLGCGQQEVSGQTRNCWLVIVPRGTFEPNGFKAFPPNLAGSFNGQLYTSPLSASNWAMRIQVHLGYSPLSTFCPPSTLAREVAGTQLITRAMDSWELALNKQANCTKVYDFAATPEASSTGDLCNPSDATAGLVFTTIPIGSEAARDGTALPCNLPRILYAPVGVTAVGYGFNINNGTGFITKPVEMTPLLFAKSVTQVYRDDLPDYYPFTGNNPSFPGPSWSQSNPHNLSADPQFQQLNPGIPPFTFALQSIAPLLTEDHTAQTQQIWQWVQTDPATVAWLDKGTKSAGNTVSADPDYEKLKPQLGKAPGIDSFPRAYTGKLDLKAGEGTNQQSGKDQTKDSLDLLPYVGSYDAAGLQILTAIDPTTGEWDDQAISPNGGNGWWDTNTLPIGKVFIWGVSDTPDLAAYGLIDAALCNAAGTPSSCVTPSVASLTTALNSAKPDSAGLLQVNPAKPGKHGYPLTQVVYAAVDTNQSAAALKDYANLIAYAAGPGQTPGVAPGDLLPGYLPLTKTLKNQAQAVVAKLLKLAGGKGPTPSHSPGTGTSGSPASSHGASGGGGSVTPTPASSSPAEFTVSQSSPQLAAATTQKQALGAIRWALLVVVIAGAACATSGAALRSARVPAWLKRMRT